MIDSRWWHLELLKRNLTIVCIKPTPLVLFIHCLKFGIAERIGVMGE